MPTYEYACTSCGERLEVVQRFTDDPLTICPECEGALRKVFSPVGVVFKGSGFYKTDSRGSGKSGGSSAEPKPSEKADTTSSTTTSGGTTDGAGSASNATTSTSTATGPSSGASSSSSGTSPGGTERVA
jgi:putative FmdB family regulatory protein